MTMQFKRKILDISEPTADGRVYPSHEIEKAIAECNWTVPIVLGGLSVTHSGVDLAEIAGYATGLFLEGKTLSADINIMDTPSGKIASQLIGVDNFSYNICGRGTVSCAVDGTEVISEYQLFAISITPKQREPLND